jgi:hypothetical protein
MDILVFRNALAIYDRSTIYQLYNSIMAYLLVDVTSFSSEIITELVTMC